MLPIPALFITAYLVCIVLKLISYYQVNAELYDIAERMRRTPTNDNYRELFAQHEVDSTNL